MRTRVGTGRRILGAASAAAALVTTGALAGCQPAGGTVTTAASGQTVIFEAAEGVDNGVKITADADSLVISDTADEVVAQGPCTAIDAQAVRCPRLNGNPFKVQIFLGDGNDTATNAATETVLLSGEDGNDTLEGGPLRDVLIGARGVDVLDGGGGDDILEDGSPGSPDRDVFRGGPGDDSVSYSDETAGVVVDLDGAADDGRSREFDQVALDVEGVAGSEFADRLTGNAKDNVLSGSGGDDVLIGQAGFDLLFGGPGTDSCDLGRGSGTAVDCET